MRNCIAVEFQPEFGQGVLPISMPSVAAVHAGVFGFDEQGVVVPSMEDVRAMTQEHARELLGIAMDTAHLRHCWLHGVDPVSGKAPRGNEKLLALRERLARESEKLQQHYADMLAAYAEGFGWAAADALHEFVTKNCLDTSPEARPLVQHEMF